MPTKTLTTADKDAGYFLMQGTTASDRIFDDTDSVQEYVVYLEHTYSTATEDETITETVKYQKTNGEEIAPSETKSVTVTHSGIKDNVTGQVNWTEDDKGGADTWTLKDGDSATISGVTSPTIDHYVADKTTINPVTVDVAKITTDANGQITVPLSGDPNESTVTFTNDGGNQTQELTQVVTYTELGTFSVQYVDQDNGNQVIPDTGYTSAVTRYGDQITYSTADTIADLEKKGYVLVNNEFDQTGQSFGDSSNGHTYTVTLKHGQVPVTPENPGDPGQPINPDDPDGPKWPAGTAKSDLTKDATQTIHYTGAGKDTPKDSVTPHEGAFTKTVTVDKVTGEIVSQTDFTGDPYTFGTVDTPVVDGYHTDKATAGGLTATVDNPNPTDTETYIANGQLIPVDQDGNTIPGTPTTTYTTDPKDPTKVVTEIPDVPGYTPTINGQPVTPGSYTPSDPGQPGQPINPNDPNGPKWPAGTGASDLVKDATQTIHYQGVSGVEDSVTTIKGAFEKTVTVDLVTGKIVSETDFTGQANFETVNTPVVNGYHADKALAGGLTATPDQPNVSDTVTYQANGKVVPVDENGKPIPGADQPTYPTDPSDPTKVLPVPVPAVPGYTTKTTIVTPSDPGANTTVTYEKVVDEAPVTPATPAKPTATPQAKQAPAKEAANQATLPQTGNEDDAPVAVAGGLLAGLMGLLGLLGFKKKQDD